MALLLCVFLWQPPLARSASTNGIIPHSVRIWQMDDGLPQNSVFAIAQSADGYLWVGTREGLARFDGMRFTPIDETIAPELKHGWITALCGASDGSLWVTCDGAGVIRLKQGVATRFAETNGLPSNRTHCLFEARDGSIWIGSEGGLTQYRDGKLKTYTDKNNLAHVSVSGIFEGPEGIVRVATKAGLSSVPREGPISTMRLPGGSVPNTLKSVWEDRHTNLWVCSNEGLTRINNQGRLTFTVNEGLPDRRATVIYEDRAGHVWAGTYGGLACLVDGKVVSTPMNAAGFNDLVYTVFEDREENLWVGGRDGLYCLRPARFSTYTTQEGLSCNNVMSVLEDRFGAIWLATWGGGVNRLKGNRISVICATNGLGRDEVLSLHESREGKLWVGLDFSGLHRLDGAGGNSVMRTEGLFNAGIRAIHEDRSGTLWLGTRVGLNVERQNKFVGYTTAKGLAGNDVMVVHEDRQGTMWIGTDGGLSRWDNGKFVNYTVKDGLAHNFVNSIHEAADGTLWLGTKGGLNRFKDGKFTTYSTRDGLFSDEIYEILEDDFGFFWMSCRKGIFRISQKDLRELDSGKLKEITCTAFGKADGLLSVQCNGVAKPGGWKARDGRLWFPTIRGVVAVEPRIKTNEKPPPVVIEEVIADQQLLNPGEHIPANARAFEVPPGRGEIEFRYTALSLQAPEKNRFKYRIKEIDPDWVEGGANRSVRYNNVGPGTYHFQVIACNNDGVWNLEGATLALIFLPHYWQTWWFKAAVCAVIGLLLTALYHARVKRLREIESLRVQIAADLHDDVGSRLTKVAMVTEYVDTETPAADPSKKHIQNIAKTTREIIQAMDEIVWTINPKNDTLDNLANYIFQYAQDYFQNSGVRCRMDLPTRLPELTVSTQGRHNLFMAVKEALNNVLKHARATEVRISLAADDSNLTITVADNGRGFATENPGPTRNGLENMRQRLARIGGTLTLESKMGSGTTVRMEAKGK